MNIVKYLENRSNNFTLMRFFAAFFVLYGHSYPLSQGIENGEDPISNLLLKVWGESLPSLSVNLFFVTSGFLVCASYMKRTDLFIFIEARALRIFPGLLVAIIFCLLVGGIVTTENILNYWTSISTMNFFKNNIFLLNGIQFDLPGVFLDNPYPRSVNGSLWTLPIEVYMYLLVALLGSLSLLKSEQSFNLIFLVCSLIYIFSLQNKTILFFDQKTVSLGLLFLMGAFFYVNSARVPLGFLTFFALVFLVYFTRNLDISFYFKYILFAYSVLLLALHPKLALPSIEKWGDISYGLYIYAFPVQQFISYSVKDIHPLSLFLYSSVVTFCLAVLSWRFIEKPALTLKGKIFSFQLLYKNSH